MSYKIAICDDEPAHIEKIRNILLDYETINYSDPAALLKAVSEGARFDVLFLDIMMPQLDGISLARELREYDMDMLIVFITSKIEFIQAGYEVRAFRYLLKEQMEDGLPKIWRDIEKELSDRGFITVGQFAACISAFGGLQAMTEALISMVADQNGKADFVGDFYDFFDNATETEGDKPFDKFQNEIAARNVCFAYPVNNKEVLHDVSFTIKKGERVVIVGENGSGKTTLSKIIAGVYEPCSGEVAYDGENAKEYERAGFYRQFSVISQDFVRYQLTMRENIGMSTPNQMHNDEKLLQSAKAADIEQIVRRVGGLDTQLGREFDGVELSSGEWQKISIARGLNKDADIIILDEPTSALDPLVEYDILKKFVDLTEGKTSVIISHRVGLCRFADRIIVMQDGRVAGNGTHEELLGSNAEYKRIWNEQAKWYAE